MTTMARSKTSTVLDIKKDQNKYLEGPDMMDNSTVVSELRESFRLSQPTPSLIFGGILFLVVEATNCLLTIPS